MKQTIEYTFYNWSPLKSWEGHVSLAVPDGPLGQAPIAELKGTSKGREVDGTEGADGNAMRRKVSCVFVHGPAQHFVKIRRMRSFQGGVPVCACVLGGLIS